MDKDTRLVGVIVAATFGYVLMEALIRRAATFNAWRRDYLAPFLQHPGRREFLRDALIREEMTTRKTTSPDDCTECP